MKSHNCLPQNYLAIRYTVYVYTYLATVCFNGLDWDISSYLHLAYLLLHVDMCKTKIQPLWDWALSSKGVATVHSKWHNWPVLNGHRTNSRSCNKDSETSWIEISAWYKEMWSNSCPLRIAIDTILSPHRGVLNWLWPTTQHNYLPHILAWQLPQHMIACCYCTRRWQLN